MILFLNPLLTGFTLSTLWSWFVAPTFHIAGLSIPNALGVVLVVGLMTGPHEDKKVDELIEDDKYFQALLNVLFRQLYVLLLGIIFHYFI